MDATAVRGAALAVLVLVAGLARAEGLTVSADAFGWPRWQARLALSAAAPEPNPALRATQLFGDYYFTGPGFGGGSIAGGLRATSGLLLDSRSPSLGTPALPSYQGPSLGQTARHGADSSETSSPAAYLGVGYTGVSPRGGWGFTADIGLMGQGLRPDRSTASGPTLDDLLRDLRLTPVLQLGVSYSF